MSLIARLIVLAVILAGAWWIAAVITEWARGLGDPWKEPGPWPAVLTRRGGHAGQRCLSCQPGGFIPGRQGDFDTDTGMRALTGWKLRAQYDRRVDDQRRRQARWAALGRGSRRTARPSPASSASRSAR